ncbi:MAG: prolipoprotein diacylglyceryl transferase [Microbacteriaceae bacterium]
MFVPLSIPSPNYDWQGIVIPIGEWLHGILPFVSVDAALNVRSYAICILLGIVAAGWLTNRRLTKRGAEPGVVLDIVIWAIPLGIVGARIFHVLTHPNDYFGEGTQFIKVFFVWEGGIAIFGALLGGAIGALIGCHLTGIKFWTFADALAPGLLLAQAFGRFGNWFNHELFGLPVSNDYPLGLEIESTNAAYPPGLPDGTLFHPTFLYEVIWNLLGVAVILLAERHFRLQWGKVFGVYLIWYGMGRTVFESIRIDPSEIFFGVRTNVWAAFFAVLVGVIIIVVQSRRHPGIEPSAYRVGREWAGPDAVVDSAETYSDISDESGNDAGSTSDALATSGPATSGTGT